VTIRRKSLPGQLYVLVCKQPQGGQKIKATSTDPFKWNADKRGALDVGTLGEGYKPCKPELNKVY